LCVYLFVGPPYYSQRAVFASPLHRLCISRLATASRPMQGYNPDSMSDKAGNDHAAAVPLIEHTVTAREITQNKDGKAINANHVMEDILHIHRANNCADIIPVRKEVR